MTWSPAEAFLACYDCGLLHPLHDAPVLGSDDLSESRLEADGEFALAHQFHRTGMMHRRTAYATANRPLWDPMASVLFDVTDGAACYVVRRWRPAVDDPCCYRFHPGRLDVEARDIEIAGDDVRRGLDREFYPYALRPGTVDRFIAVLHEVVGRIAPDDLEIAFDDAVDPDVSIAPLPDPVYDQLAVHSVAIFDDWECLRVLRFLANNRHADGLLAVRIRRHTSVVNESLADR